MWRNGKKESCIVALVLVFPLVTKIFRINKGTKRRFLCIHIKKWKPVSKNGHKRLLSGCTFDRSSSFSTRPFPPFSGRSRFRPMAPARPTRAAPSFVSTRAYTHFVAFPAVASSSPPRGRKRQLVLLSCPASKRVAIVGEEKETTHRAWQIEDGGEIVDGKNAVMVDDRATVGGAGFSRVEGKDDFV